MTDSRVDSGALDLKAHCLYLQRYIAQPTVPGKFKLAFKMRKSD